MMKIHKFVKSLLLAICLYVIISKIYAIVLYIINGRIDIIRLLVDFAVIGSCINFPITLRKKYRLNYRVILGLVLLVVIYLQLFYWLFDYFSRDERSNTALILWTFDVPNFLSVFIISFLIYINVRNSD